MFDVHFLVNTSYETTSFITKMYFFLIKLAAFQAGSRVFTTDTRHLKPFGSRGKNEIKI